MRWKFDTESGRNLALRSADDAASGVTRASGFLFENYSSEEFVEASRFLEFSKKRLNEKLDEMIADFKRKGDA